MKINYVTTNGLKFAIAGKFFEGNARYELHQLLLDIPEIQASSCEHIARESAIYAARHIGEPCVAMDAGFFITALHGFPGPFVKYVNDWLSEDRLLKMLDENDDRTAYFEDALAIGFADGTSQVFTRKTMGKLARAGEYTPSKWPANSLFVPDGHSAPLGSLSEEEQADFWVRENKTWAELIAFLAKKPDSISS